MLNWVVKCTNPDHGVVGAYTDSEDAENCLELHQLYCDCAVKIVKTGMPQAQSREALFLNARQSNHSKAKVYQFVRASESNIYLLESSIRAEGLS